MAETVGSSIITEGDAREHVEENPDKAVVLHDGDSEQDYAWLFVGIEGFTAAVKHPLFGITEASIYGDDEELRRDDDTSVRVIDLDDAPFDWHSQ